MPDRHHHHINDGLVLYHDHDGVTTDNPAHNDIDGWNHDVDIDHDDDACYDDHSA